MYYNQIYLMIFFNLKSFRVLETRNDLFFSICKIKSYPNLPAVEAITNAAYVRIKPAAKCVKPTKRA